MRQTLDFRDIQFKESGEISRRGLNPTPKLGNLDPPLDRARLRDKFIFPTDLFSGSLILYLVLFLIENIFPGVISREFSLNYLLIPVLIFGVLSSVFPETENPPTLENYGEATKKSDIFLSFVLSIIGAGLIYYKVDLIFNLRLIIACISGLLILMMSLLVILPEDFKLPKINFNKKYLFIFLIVPLTAFIFWRINQSKKVETIIRIAPDKYNIVLINKTNDPKYFDTYKKLLVNNGYINVSIGDDTSILETTSKATVMYGPADSVAGKEITDLIGLSYKDIQTSPINNSQPNTIVVVIK